VYLALSKGGRYTRGACGTDAPAAAMEAPVAYQQGIATDIHAAASHACAFGMGMSGRELVMLDHA
jgi:hypothetical protein